MITRIKQAISKICFCFNISNNTGSFIKLLSRSKQFKWGIEHYRSHASSNEVAETYNFRLYKKPLQISLRTYAGDIAIFYEVFWNEVYALPAEYYKNARTIVDLGANVGLASLYFSLASPDAVIYAIEPETSNFQLLLINLHNEIVHNNIIPIQAAIDLEDGEASLQVNDMRYNSIITRTTHTHDMIRTLSMHTLLKEYSIERIDILKIDIEGTEKRLFEGDVTWLECVHYILIEFHSEAIRAFCMDVLTSKKFTLHLIKTGNVRSNLFWAEQELWNGKL